MRELRIQEKDAGQRLDKYLKKYLNKAPGSFIYKMLRKKNIKLNRGRADGSELIRAQDIVQLYLADETIDGFRETIRVTASACPDIVYEDGHILLLNKPAGLLVQKAGPADESLVDQLLYYLSGTGEYDPAGGGCKPSICNRLDRNTSGLVLAGKDQGALQFLSGLLKERTLDKYYLCLVKGELKEPVRIRGYLKKDRTANLVSVSAAYSEHADPIDTAFEPLGGNKNVTLVKVKLITGKSHQIRSQLLSMGYPIIGDPKYGDASVNRFYRKKYGLNRQLLHAGTVTFPLCEGDFAYLSGKSFTAPLPGDFSAILSGEAPAAKPFIHQ